MPACGPASGVSRTGFVMPGIQRGLSPYMSSCARNPGRGGKGGQTPQPDCFRVVVCPPFVRKQIRLPHGRNLTSADTDMRSCAQKTALGV